ncbi:hypothetical protein ACP4OV_019257 [Aristida adscensionis]
MMSKMSLSLVPISLLLLLAAAAADAAEKRVGMTMRSADEEESRWLDRWAETQQPLGSGPFTVRPATDEESRWLNRMSDNHKRARESHGGGGGGGDGGNYLEFDEDNPYYHALRSWVSRQIKEHGDLSGMHEKPHFEDL